MIVVSIVHVVVLNVFIDLSVNDIWDMDDWNQLIIEYIKISFF
jgi:hypothetical protein